MPKHPSPEVADDGWDDRSDDRHTMDVTTGVTMDARQAQDGHTTGTTTDAQRGHVVGGRVVGATMDI